MLAQRVEMHMRKALAPLLFDDEDGPVRESPVAKAGPFAAGPAEGGREARPLRRGRHDFRGLLRHLGTLTMTGSNPSGKAGGGSTFPRRRRRSRTGPAAAEREAPGR